MTKQKIGLVLFWIGIVWTVVWEVVPVVKILPLMHSLTVDEFNQTIWALTGPLMSLRGMSMPLGAIVAGIGILHYSSAKGSTIWRVGIGLFIVLTISLVAMGLNFYSAPIFGIGGSLIFLSFIGILWSLAKERIALKDSSTTALDIKLVGYVFIYGAHRRIHRHKTIAFSSDDPIMISTVDEDDKINKMITALETMISGGCMIAISDVTVVKYVDHPDGKPSDATETAQP